MHEAGRNKGKMKIVYLTRLDLDPILGPLLVQDPVVASAAFNALSVCDLDLLATVCTDVLDH